MAQRGRPKRSNPQADRKIFKAEVTSCPSCHQALTSVGNAAHSKKTVQTLDGEYQVVAYSRLCNTLSCKKYGHHYHAIGHLKVSLPGETYGLDIVAYIGWQRDHEHRRFSEIHKLLNEKGIEINERSVGRLYRLYQALLKGGWKKIRERLSETEAEYGGLIIAGDGLKPDGCGGTLYVLYEVLSGTPVGAMWQDVADAVRLTAWMRETEAAKFKVLATMSDKEDALIIGFNTVWPASKHQLCQSHFVGALSEPVHHADRELHAGLRSGLKKLPQPPLLKGEEEEIVDAPAEKKTSEEGCFPLKEEVQSTSNCQEQSRHPEPLLQNLLFPEYPLPLIDRKNGLPISQEAVLWDRYYRYYLLGIKDALRLSRRKPFQLGGVAGHDQLMGMLNHMEQDEHPLYKEDPFRKKLINILREVTTSTRHLVKDIRQGLIFLQKEVEHFLAHIPRPPDPRLDTPQEPPTVFSSDESDVEEQEPPAGTTARYKVGDIATGTIKQIWQFTFRPIRAVHFCKGQFWYLFEECDTGFCEADVLLASEAGTVDDVFFGIVKPFW